MSDPYLLLWLEAPLQSWGHDSKFGRRDSLDFPTKSGVLGLICCARGEGGPEVDWLKEWEDLDMQVVAYVPQDQKGESQPLLRDFHMVGNGYDELDPWQKLLIPKTSKGTKAVGGGTKMTYRYYLQGMSFAVAMQAPSHRVEQIRDALTSPAWDLYLGRKNCAPTEFIEQGVFETADLAHIAGAQMASTKNYAEKFRVLQGSHDGEILTLNDVPQQFGQDKRYRDRQVTVLHQD